jgi:Asp-tRNA(Asn)/Glu-tRNA(Gln) amidotransferase A subunit family amidase
LTNRTSVLDIRFAALVRAIGNRRRFQRNVNSAQTQSIGARAGSDSVHGGSSSGSAVAVARGLVSFSLGTDTAGSGRVPAMLNNLVGREPTLGLLSTQGVVPPCRSIDAVSVFALTAEDAQRVIAAAAGFGADDPFLRAAEPYGSDFGSLVAGIPAPLGIGTIELVDGSSVMGFVCGHRRH